MPDGAQDRMIDLGSVRTALGNWLAQHQIVLNGQDDPVSAENPDGIGTAGDIPNVAHFMSYLYNNYHTKE